jgi:sensor histidine kinase YesM
MLPRFIFILFLLQLFFILFLVILSFFYYRRYSYDLQSVINRMMDKNPRTRPSVEELINNDRWIGLRLREMKVTE